MHRARRYAMPKLTCLVLLTTGLAACGGGGGGGGSGGESDAPILDNAPNDAVEIGYVGLLTAVSYTTSIGMVADAASAGLTVMRAGQRDTIACGQRGRIVVAHTDTDASGTVGDGDAVSLTLDDCAGFTRMADAAEVIRITGVLSGELRNVDTETSAEYQRVTLRVSDADVRLFEYPDGGTRGSGLPVALSGAVSLVASVPAESGAPSTGASAVAGSATRLTQDDVTFASSFFLLSASYSPDAGRTSALFQAVVDVEELGPVEFPANSGGTGFALPALVRRDALGTVSFAEPVDGVFLGVPFRVDGASDVLTVTANDESADVPADEVSQVWFAPPPAAVVFSAYSAAPRATDDRPVVVGPAAPIRVAFSRVVDRSTLPSELVGMPPDGSGDGPDIVPLAASGVGGVVVLTPMRDLRAGWEYAVTLDGVRSDAGAFPDASAGVAPNWTIIAAP